MSQRPTFRAQLDSQRPRGATSLIGEQTLEQRVAALEAWQKEELEDSPWAK